VLSFSVLRLPLVSFFKPGKERQADLEQCVPQGNDPDSSGNNHGSSAEQTMQEFLEPQPPPYQTPTESLRTMDASAWTTGQGPIMELLDAMRTGVDDAFHHEDQSDVDFFDLLLEVLWDTVKLYGILDNAAISGYIDSKTAIERRKSVSGYQAELLIQIYETNEALNPIDGRSDGRSHCFTTVGRSCWSSIQVCLEKAMAMCF
jgi:hypothetical protein